MIFYSNEFADILLDKSMHYLFIDGPVLVKLLKWVPDAGKPVLLLEGGNSKLMYHFIIALH
jgi:hypothetical protein